MHEMQTIVTDVRGVRQSVSLSVTRLLCCAKTAKQIKIPFGVNERSWGAQQINGGPDPSHNEVTVTLF